MKLIFSFLLIIQSLISFSQVKLQTGATEFSIPLYNYSDPNNRLNTGVSLIYTAGNGLKVNGIASNTGTGWELNAGGYIQRIQYGEPDDQKNYDTYSYPFLPNSDPQSAFWVWAKNYYPNGFLQSEFFSSDPISNRGAYTPMYPPPYYYYKPPQTFSADREQDVFKFSFAGREGYFLIGRKNVLGNSEIRTLYDSKLKIEIAEGDLNNTQNIRTTISKFSITDENGIKYTFQESDLDQVCDFDQGSEYSSATGAFQYNVTNVNSTPYVNNFRVIRGTPRNSYTKNKWNLSEIINPNTQVKIIFQYDTYNVDIKTQKLIQRSISGNNDRINITQERSISQVKRLKKIILNNNESVNFEYSLSNRIDVSGDNSLSRISIKYQNEVKLNWDFSYGYFVKSDIKAPDFNYSTQDKVWARLCLLSVQKSSPLGQNEPPYIFDYFRGNEDNLNSAVPPMFSCQQNLGGYYSTTLFGFYNPSNNTTSNSNSPYEPSGADLLPKSLYQNILAGLNYNPSLGYGTGTSTVGPSIEARNGIIKSIKYPLGGELNYEYEMNYVGTLPVKAFYGVRVKKIVEYDGINHLNDKITEYKYNDANNNSSAWGYENCENKDIVTVRVRQDCVSGISPLLNMLSIAKSFSSYAINKLNNPYSTSGVVNIGGSQVPVFAIVYMAYIVYSILDGFFGNNSAQYSTFNMDVYTNRFINNNLLPFQYSRVEVINKSGPGDNGRSINEFTSPSSISSSTGSFQIDFPNISKPYSNKQRYAYWIYGMPEKLTILDKYNNMVEQVINTYNPIKSFLNNTSYESKKWMPLQYEYSCGFNPPSEDINAFNKISSESYYPIRGSLELANTKEYTFNATGQTFLNETFYEYSPINYLLNKIKVTNSKGELVVKKTYYPEDYSATGFFGALVNNNMVNVPISSETWVTKSGGQAQLITANATEFAVIGNGDIKPFKVYSLETAAPVLESILQPFNPNSVVRDVNYLKEQQQYVYDNITGNIAGTISKGKMSTVLYDYNDALISMKIQNANASPGYFAFTSFEAQNKGGWNYNPQGIQQQSTPTGKYCYQLSSNNNISSTIFFTKPYLLSFWASNSNVLVNGGFNPSKTVSNIPGWTYYEFEMAAGTSSPYISGSVLIDEVRLYAKDARMVTYTYDQFNNKTSECDANNHIVYYEYDGLARVILIRDQNKNILKKYCYNYSGQQENCTISTSAQWQSTGNLRCVLDGSGNYTGYQERQERDLNAASASYNQLRWVDNGYNLSACPLPTTCNSTNCYGEAYTCINGICEQGYRVNTGSYYESSINRYVCVYHYEFSDGSWSQDYTQYSYFECPIL